MPGILKRTVKPGNVREGFSLTGSNGTSASPTNATQTKATIRVKAEAFEDFFISRFIFCITIIYVNRNLCHINDSISVYDRLNGDTTENKRRNYHLISLPPLKSNLSESESFVAKSNNVSRRIL